MTGSRVTIYYAIVGKAQLTQVLDKVKDTPALATNYILVMLQSTQTMASLESRPQLMVRATTKRKKIPMTERLSSRHTDRAVHTLDMAVSAPHKVTSAVPDVDSRPIRQHQHDGRPCPILAVPDR